MTCGGSFPPLRFAPFPVTSTASSTTSRGTQDASTPREIQSLKRPAATLPVCVITRDHAGCQPEHPEVTHRTDKDQLKLSGIGIIPQDVLRARTMPRLTVSCPSFHIWATVCP